MTDDLRARIIEAIRPQIERGNDVREWPSDEIEFQRHGDWTSFTDRHEKVVEMRLAKAADAVLAEIKRDMLSAAVAERWEVAYQYENLDAAESAYVGDSRPGEDALSMEIRPVLNEVVAGADWHPGGTGWFESDEQIDGREFIVHGWLRRPIDSMHQQRVWMREPAAYIDGDED